MIENLFLKEDFDPDLASPISFGYSLSKYQNEHDKKLDRKPLIDREKCTEREFIEHLVFPVLMPALEKMLDEAKKSNCFEVCF